MGQNQATLCVASWRLNSDLEAFIAQCLLHKTILPISGFTKNG
jgi:hypothetical protein